MSRALAAAATAAFMVPAVSAQELDLDRVILSTGGVGYFEFAAPVEGDAELTLDVRRDQIDDMLKSLVVYDDAGQVRSVRLPGQEPLRDLFRDLPFGREALESPPALLQALKGAQVRIEGPTVAEGRVMAVTPEVVELPDGGTTVRHRLGVVTEDGIVQVVLEQADSVQFADPELRAQVGQALAAILDGARREGRTLSIGLEGEGSRDVRIAYLAEVPLWKATYRLTLAPEGAAGDADLQGWTVLENLSGRDWAGVELAVTSGNPVTFRQDLYDPYYVARPTVPVEVMGRVLPRPDMGGIAVESEGDVERGALYDVPAEAMSAPAPMAEAMPTMQARGPLPSAPPAMARVEAAATAAGTAQVTFTFPQPVTISSGQTAMLPIVSRDLPVERIALYQPETHATHPLMSVRLTNPTDTGLPPGVLTLYERRADGAVSYLGDARLSPLPSGEDRLLSFAVDLETRIDRDQEQASDIVGARVVGGVLRLSVVERLTTRYRLAAPQDEPRSVLIEHDRVPGYELVSPTAAETTDTDWRIPVRLAAGQTETVPVVLERTAAQEVYLADLPMSELFFYLENAELSEEQEAALRELADLQQRVIDAERDLAQLEAERRELMEEQERVRQNLRTVREGSDAYNRFLTRLQDLETEFEANEAARDRQREALEAAREARDAFLRELDV